MKLYCADNCPLKTTMDANEKELTFKIKDRPHCGENLDIHDIKVSTIT